MLFERLPIIKDGNAVWNEYSSQTASVAAISENPSLSEKEYYSKLLKSQDIYLALSASLCLKKLFPPTNQTKSIVSDIFAEAEDSLIHRACSGPAQLRIAALKALIFDAGYLSFTDISHILESTESISEHESFYSGNFQSLTRIMPQSNFFLTEALGAIIAVLPNKNERFDLIKRELSLQNETRIISALNSLQMVPAEEPTNLVLQLARSENFRISKEAIKSLLICGGSKVYLIILSILKEINNPEQKAELLPIAALTHREEAWIMIKESMNSENIKLTKSALIASDIISINDDEKSEFYKKLMKHSDPEVSCISAALAWKHGSLKAIKVITKHLESNSKKSRAAASKVLSHINPEQSIPILIKKFNEETNGDVIRENILSIRRILTQNSEVTLQYADFFMPWLNRLFKSTDPFKRVQSAVLCGLVGKASKDTLLSALNKEKHPYVLSAIIKALGKCDFDRILVYSAYAQNNDSRVRAATIESLPITGTSMSYYTQALKDENPRVKAAAIIKLYLSGQTDVIRKANEMINVPSPEAVLAGCYALSRTVRIQPAILKENEPLSLSIASKARFNLRSEECGPAFLNSPDIADLFAEMALSGGNRHRLTWLLEEYNRKTPENYAVRRMLASMLAIEGDYSKALNLIDLCLNENPGSLSDLLDAYRISLRLCEMKKAALYGNKLRKLYITLTLACKHVCTTLTNKQAEALNKKLEALKEPSMNLYNVMIQIKIIEKDNQGALDLLTEVLLSRPFNGNIAKKLASMLPENCSELKVSLEAYAASLPVTIIGV